MFEHKSGPSLIYILSFTVNLHYAANNAVMMIINWFVDEIKKRKVVLSKFAPDNQLSANDRRVKASIKRILQIMLNNLRMIVSNLDYIPMNAFLVLN